MSDKVSIIIPTFNGSKTIKAALNGVLKQTYEDYEIIIVDDGSTDSTVDIVREFLPSVNIIHQRNQGTMAARQTGIGKATGKFIALLEAQDDIWFPEMLKTEIGILRKRS